jgi:ubiquitin-like modifier-activating enzyme ATG7
MTFPSPNSVARNDAAQEEAEELDPNRALVSSICIAHCDLKTKITVYWFAFPALIPRPQRGLSFSLRRGLRRQKQPQTRIIDEWGPHGCRKLSRAFDNFRIRLEKRRTIMAEGGAGVNDVWCPPFFLVLLSNNDDPSEMRCLEFDHRTYQALSDEERSHVIFGFLDSSMTSPISDAIGARDNKTVPLPVGWTLRNLVAYLSLKLGLGGHERIFLSYRGPPLRRIDVSFTTEEDNKKENEIDDDYDAGVGGSLLLDLTIPLAEDYCWPVSLTANTDTNTDTTGDDAPRKTIHIDQSMKIQSQYRCVGWELNQNNRPGPRSVDLRPLVSPAHLVRQANDLNLRLMKWRALPELNVDMLGRMNVLLLGAGTLGCSVARTLLGWGIRRMTLVDSGRVSYSNPVRQSLFDINDCKDGGRHKAVAAANALKAIAGPDVFAEGVVLTIPMPGHSFGRSIDETEAVQVDVERLHTLIDEADVVFLLTDTRESRWLPTVIALATDTPMINVALGLDSWLVMRHGSASSSRPLTTKVRTINDKNDETAIALTSKDVIGEMHSLAMGQQQGRLGCYFCGDIVAPENSMKDRTLDQQCTVTRPGVAPIAASMATELMVAMFHHPAGHRAPAPEQHCVRDGGVSGNSNNFAPIDKFAKEPSSSPLGRLPHQIRGTVATYTMMTPTVPAFPSCTACANTVVNKYQTSGFDFIKAVCCDSHGSYLEEVSGLAGFREQAARKLDECIFWDEDNNENV